MGHRRSTGIPRGKALGGITKIIAARTSPKTIKRPTETVGSLGETQEQLQEDHIEDLWLFRPEENRVQSVAGERITGDLGGLTLSDGRTDVKKDDVILHGGVEYEVDTVEGLPDEDDPDYWVVNFLRRQ